MSEMAFSCHTVNQLLLRNDYQSTNISIIQANHRDKSSSNRYLVINQDCTDTIPDNKRYTDGNKSTCVTGLAFLGRNYHKKIYLTVEHLYLVWSHSQNTMNLRITNKIHNVLLNVNSSKVDQKLIK